MISIYFVYHLFYYWDLYFLPLPILFSISFHFLYFLTNFHFQLVLSIFLPIAFPFSCSLLFQYSLFLFLLHLSCPFCIQTPSFLAFQDNLFMHQFFPVLTSNLSSVCHLFPFLHYPPCFLFLSSNMGFSHSFHSHFSFTCSFSLSLIHTGHVPQVTSTLT